MTTPTVSVIMATYNGADLIGETLDRLRAQTFADFELIVVDDCSTDETAEKIEGAGDPRFRVFRSDRNQGPVLARNRAIRHARGRYVAALDHDDLCAPDRFARQVAYLDAHPDVVLLGTNTSVLQNGKLIASSLPAVTTPFLIEWLIRIMNPLVWSSVMLRREAALRLDPFTRNDRLYAEDFDLYHRLGRLGRLARLDDDLLTYRSHGGGLSQRRTDDMAESAMQVLAEAHAEQFGEFAPDVAALLVRHVMLRAPVRDRATLERLGSALVAMQDHFIATHRPDAESRKLLRWETAQLWSRIGRAGLRSGALNLGDTMAVRPDHLGLGYAAFHELVLSRIVGGARAARRAQLAG
jgi:GT2 family glycosyltransferase